LVRNHLILMKMDLVIKTNSLF